MTRFAPVIRLGIAWRVLVLLGALIFLTGIFLAGMDLRDLLWAGGLYALAAIASMRHRALLLRTLGRTSSADLGEVLGGFHRANTRIAQLALGDILVRGLPRITRESERSLPEWGVVAELVVSKRQDLATVAREAILRSGVEPRSLLDHKARLLVDAKWCRDRAATVVSAAAFAGATLILLSNLVGIADGFWLWLLVGGVMAGTMWFLANAEKPKTVVAKAPSVAVELARGALETPLPWVQGYRVLALATGLGVTDNFSGLSLDDWKLLIRAARLVSPAARRNVFLSAQESAPLELLPALAAEAEFWGRRRGKDSHATISAITAARLAIASRPPELFSQSPALIQEVP